MADFSNSHFESALPSYEISFYIDLDISLLRLDKSAFTGGNFATVKFWYARKTDFQKLFALCVRVFPISLPPRSSETVFSALNNILTRDRARTNSTLLEDTDFSGLPTRKVFSLSIHEQCPVICRPQ